MNIRQELERIITAALAAAGAADAPACQGEIPKGPSPAMVAPTDPQFGDYKASGVMAAAKKLKVNPRELATKVVENLRAGPLASLAEKIDIAGPGFINIKLKNEFLEQRVASLRDDPHLGVERPVNPQTVVVDYSATNLAKEMHVGHLRSTIIGDALARTLDFTGQKVIRQNHVGDWGTQFGMVILGIWHIAFSEYRNEPRYIGDVLESLTPLNKESPLSDRKLAIEPFVTKQESELLEDFDGEKVFHPFLRNITSGNRLLSLSELLPAYKLVNKTEELGEGTGLTILTSPDRVRVPFASLSSYVASMLQDFTEPRNLEEREAWKYARQTTIEECQKIYTRLGTLLTETDVRGESFYGGIDQQCLVHEPEKDMLPSVVAELAARGMLQESQGAMCVFFPQFVAKDGAPLPLIVQKSNEGFLYATTDLAAICCRVRQLRADRILYVVDKRQSLHFQMVFATASAAGFDVKPGPQDGRRNWSTWLSAR